MKWKILYQTLDIEQEKQLIYSLYRDELAVWKIVKFRDIMSRKF